MCRYASADEITKSRFRWYDLPAMLFLHRPVRCIKCGERSYAMQLGAMRYPAMPKLWMHYSVALLITAGIVASLTITPADVRWALHKAVLEPISRIELIESSDAIQN